jgi:hypothetical protein
MDEITARGENSVLLFFVSNLPNRGITGREFRRYSLLAFFLSAITYQHPYSFIAESCKLTDKEINATLDEFLAWGWLKEETTPLGQLVYRCNFDLKNPKENNNGA